MPTPVHEPSFLVEVWALYAVGESNATVDAEAVMVADFACFQALLSCCFVLLFALAQWASANSTETIIYLCSFCFAIAEMPSQST